MDALIPTYHLKFNFYCSCVIIVYHNHVYPLLYKANKFWASSQGKFLACQNMPDMYAHSFRDSGPQALGIHIRQIPPTYVTA